MRLAKLFFVNEVEYHDLSKKDLYANLKAMTRQYFYLTQLNVSCKNRYKRLTFGSIKTSPYSVDNITILFPLATSTLNTEKQLWYFKKNEDKYKRLYEISQVVFC